MIDALRPLDRYAPHALAALRIIAALLFIEHGTQKMFGFPSAPPGGGSPAFGTLVWFAMILEVFGGLLLLVGFLTRPVALLLSGQMAFAYFWAHAPRGFYPVVNGGEPAILFCFIFLYIACAGPGLFSVDAARAGSGYKRSWER